MAEASSPERVARRLREALVAADARSRLVVTDNRVRLVSVRRAPGALEVRVSRHLLAVGGDVVDPVVAFVAGRPRARTRLRALFARVESPAPTRRRPTPTLAPRGHVHDLAALLEAESLAAFGEPAGVPVTWSARGRVARGQRSIRLGSWSTATGVIRIHRLLDDPEAPAWLVGFVLYHELLHQRLGIDESGPRRAIHPPAFRALERRHPRFEDAGRWEREVLPRLMDRAGRRRG